MVSILANDTINNLRIEDSAIHRWYRFVLSFPPHLVRTYLDQFGAEADQIVLDPFCGTGTTIVEARKMGLSAIGVEANPMAYFASKVKIDWTPDPDSLLSLAKMIADATTAELEKQGINDLLFFRTLDDLSLRTLPVTTSELLIEHSIDPLPLHKTLILIDQINLHQSSIFYDHLRLALARSTVQSVSNLYFGPEVGVRGRKPLASVIDPWLSVIKEMADDLRTCQRHKDPHVRVYLADARQVNKVIRPSSVSMVITSPPYPNEKDYSRTTRLESVLLGFLKDKTDLRTMKQTLVRSNTRTVYKADDDEIWIADNQRVSKLADEIETRRLALGKTSGFEKLYGRVTKLYFGGMARHLAVLRECLVPGARLVYVVGDQASYFQVMIRTGEILAEIAESLGYHCESIDLFRTRIATTTGEALREESVVLRWQGKH